MSNTQVELNKSDAADNFDLYFECITACHSINGEDIECVSACIATHLDKEDKKWLIQRIFI